MSEVDDLRRKVQSLEDQLSAAKQSLYAAELKHHRLEPGTVVLFKGEELRVVAARQLHWVKPWVIGQRKRKDGSWSAREVHCYSDWEYAGPRA